jgi:hypothetical protein
VTLANIDWTSTPPHHHATSTQANAFLLQVLQDSMPLKTTPRKATPRKTQRLGRPCLGRPKQTPPTKQESKRKTILLLKPRKTALTSPATTENSTVPPSLLSVAHPRIPSPLRAKTPGLQREPPLYRCPCVLLFFDLSHALALPTCPPAGTSLLRQPLKYTKPPSHDPKLLQ